MSANNGDKSRFHRLRKVKLARRRRTRTLIEEGRLPRPSKPARS